MDCESNKHNESETQNELFDLGDPQRLDFVCVCQNFSYQSAWLTNADILVDGIKHICAHYGYAGNFPHAVYNWIFYPPGVTHVTIWNLDINIRVEYVDWRPGVISWAWLSS